MSSSKFTIIVDTREKDVVSYDFEKFPVDVERDKLDTGDYSIEGYEDEFAVERKSLDDLATSCGKDRDRFQEQIRRGGDLGGFAVVVEGSRESVEEAEYYSGIHPNSVLGTVDSWGRVHDVDFVFCEDEEHAELKTFQKLNLWYEQQVS